MGVHLVRMYIVHSRTGCRAGAESSRICPPRAPIPCQNASTAVSADAWKRLKARDPMPVGSESYPSMDAGMQWRRRAGGLDGECQRRPSSSPCQPASPCGPRGEGGRGWKIRAPKGGQKREIFDGGMAYLAHETAWANGKHRLLSLGRDRPISETRGLGKSRTAAAFPDCSRPH